MKPGISLGRRWSSSKLMEISLKAAEGLRNAAHNALVLARQQRETAEERMRESAAAGDLLARATSGHQAYEKAEIELKHLRTMQTEERRLEKEMADTEKKKAELDGKADAARLQADALALQKREKEAEKATFLNESTHCGFVFPILSRNSKSKRARCTRDEGPVRHPSFREQFRDLARTRRGNTEKNKGGDGGPFCRGMRLFCRKLACRKRPQTRCSSISVNNSLPRMPSILPSRHSLSRSEEASVHF